MSTTISLGTILGKTTIHSTLIIAKERLYLAADGRTIVKEGDGREAVLLAAKGQAIPPRMAERLGLTEDSLTELKESIPAADIKSRKTRVIEPETR